MGLPARFEHLLPALELCAGVAGDFAELGVWKGVTFVPLARVAARLGRRALAVDSFEGMRSPTAQDANEEGLQEYPAGCFNVGGPESLRLECSDLPNVIIHAGFIPEVLSKVETPSGLALVHVDLDQYGPTVHALRWAWDRLNPGGVLVCHDYKPGRRYQCSLAIDEFLAAVGAAPAGYNADSWHLWIRRMKEEG